jgi:hypothetical protein
MFSAICVAGALAVPATAGAGLAVPGVAAVSDVLGAAGSGGFVGPGGTAVVGVTSAGAGALVAPGVAFAGTTAWPPASAGEGAT